MDKSNLTKTRNGKSIGSPSAPVRGSSDSNVRVTLPSTVCFIQKENEINNYFFQKKYAYELLHKHEHEKYLVQDFL